MGTPTGGRGPGEVHIPGRDLCLRHTRGAGAPCGGGLGWGTPALRLQAGQGLRDAGLAQQRWGPTEGKHSLPFPTMFLP